MILWDNFIKAKVINDVGDLNGRCIQNKSAVGADEARGYRRELTFSVFFFYFNKLAVL